MNQPSTFPILKVPTLITTQCYECQQETNHNVLTCYRRVNPERKKVLLTETKNHITFYQDFFVVQCAGCNAISFLDRTYDKNGAPLDFQYPEPEITIYEELFLNDDEYKHLPKTLRGVYDEVKNALEDESKILAGIGLRTIIEAVCLQKGISGKALVNKIDNLHLRGLISASDRDVLHKLRAIGNVSAHEVKAATTATLKHAVAAVNHLLRGVYVIPKVNKRIKV